VHTKYQFKMYIKCTFLLSCEWPVYILSITISKCHQGKSLLLQFTKITGKTDNNYQVRSMIVISITNTGKNHEKISGKKFCIVPNIFSKWVFFHNIGEWCWERNTHFENFLGKHIFSSETFHDFPSEYLKYEWV